MHMNTPTGELTRRFLTRLLNVCKDDNRLLINALLNNGVEIPDKIGELGLVYNPPSPDEANDDSQGFYGLAHILQRGEFSCGDAAAYEAAVREEKYGEPTEVMCVAQGPYEYHAIYVWRGGAVDPTEDWLEQHTTETRKPDRVGANRW